MVVSRCNRDQNSIEDMTALLQQLSRGIIVSTTVTDENGSASTFWKAARSIAALEGIYGTITASQRRTQHYTRIVAVHLANILIHYNPVNDKLYNLKRK